MAPFFQRVLPQHPSAICELIPTATSLSMLLVLLSPHQSQAKTTFTYFTTNRVLPTISLCQQVYFKAHMNARNSCCLSLSAYPSHAVPINWKTINRLINMKIMGWLSKMSSGFLIYLQMQITLEVGFTVQKPKTLYGETMTYLLLCRLAPFQHPHLFSHVHLGNPLKFSSEDWKLLTVCSSYHRASRSLSRLIRTYPQLGSLLTEYFQVPHILRTAAF